MDFLKRILDEQEGKGTDANMIGEGLEASEEIAAKAWNLIIEELMPMTKRGNFMGASVAIMAAVWQIVDVAKQAAMATQQEHGDDSIVASLWEMFEAAFNSKDAAEANAKLEAIWQRRKGKQ